jgi:hypothetical protein
MPQSLFTAHSQIFNYKPFVEPVLELGDLLLVLRGAGDSGPGK